MSHDPSELSLVNGLDYVTPALRRELSFRPQTFGGKQCYVVEDPVSARFFRVGATEYSFISRLDGCKTIGEVLEETRRACSSCNFSPADAVAICQWIVRSGLAQHASDDPATATTPGRQQPPVQRRGGRISPLSIQIPLFHPDRFFQRLTPWVSWLFSSYAMIAWLLVLVWAGRDLIVHHHRLAAVSSGVLAPGNWLWLAVAWLILKVVHECGHAVACKRFHGEVREAGVIFILLAPLAYVDVTSCWRLRSKWARIAVAAAGMYVELFLGAIAALVWVRVPPGALSQVCLNVMTTATVMTVLFNANPLMRFDGYYILSDFLEMPNLYASGQQYIRYLVRRYLFGMQSAPLADGGWHGAFLRGYGLASWVWRNLVFFGLVLTAATLLEGAGVILSIVALLFWVSSQLRRLARFARSESGGKPDWLRFMFVGGSLSAAAITVLTCVPWPGSVTAPAIVRYSGESVIRTQCDGFVRKVCVRGGMHVDAGQVLVRMVNDTLSHELDELKLDIERSRIQRRIYRRQGELAKAQAETEQLRTLEKKFVEKREELEHLVVCAPRAGKVIGRGLDTLEGRHLTKGSLLMSIGDETAKEVRLSIAQPDMLDFRHQVGRTIRVYLAGIGMLRSTLAKVEPRASVVPLDVSLCASNGGTLTVRTVEAAAERSDPHDASLPTVELLSPRFTGVVQLTRQQSERVRAGQRARVALHPSETVGRHFYRMATDWVDRKLRRKRSR